MDKPAIERKKCFLITPIGEDNSLIRKKVDGLIDTIIKPIVEEMGYELIVPHKISISGSVTNQIINEIVYDDLVITNLTGLNPNVMYELAIRHSIKKPIICIAENDTKLPFDIKDNRVIFYEDNISSVNNFKNRLREFITSINNGDYKENFLFDALRDIYIEKNIDTSDIKEKDILNNIVKKLSTLEAKIDIDNFVYGDNKGKCSVFCFNSTESEKSKDITTFIVEFYSYLGMKVSASKRENGSKFLLIFINGGINPYYAEALLRRLENKFNLKNISLSFSTLGDALGVPTKTKDGFIMPKNDPFTSNESE